MVDYAKEYGAWVGGYRWSHWVHLTIDPKTERKVRKRAVRSTPSGRERVSLLWMVEPTIGRVGRAGKCPRTMDGITKAFVHEFVRYCTKVAQHDVSYAFSVEAGCSGAHWHIHALLYGTEGIACDRLVRAWRHGRAKVDVYDPARNAATYMVKEASQEAFTWDMSKTLPPPLLTRNGVSEGPVEQVIDVRHTLSARRRTESRSPAW